MNAISTKHTNEHTTPSTPSAPPESGTQRAAKASSGSPINVAFKTDDERARMAAEIRRLEVETYATTGRTRDDRLSAAALILEAIGGFEGNPVLALLNAAQHQIAVLHQAVLGAFDWDTTDTEMHADDVTMAFAGLERKLEVARQLYCREPMQPTEPKAPVLDFVTDCAKQIARHADKLEMIAADLRCEQGEPTDAIVQNCARELGAAARSIREELASMRLDLETEQAIAKQRAKAVKP